MSGIRTAKFDKSEKTAQFEFVMAQNDLLSFPIELCPDAENSDHAGDGTSIKRVSRSASKHPSYFEDQHSTLLFQNMTERGTQHRKRRRVENERLHYLVNKWRFAPIEHRIYSAGREQRSNVPLNKYQVVHYCDGSEEGIKISDVMDQVSLYSQILDANNMMKKREIQENDTDITNSDTNDTDITNSDTNYTSEIITGPTLSGVNIAIPANISSNSTELPESKQMLTSDQSNAPPSYIPPISNFANQSQNAVDQISSQDLSNQNLVDGRLMSIPNLISLTRKRENENGSKIPENVGEDVNNVSKTAMVGAVQSFLGARDLMNQAGVERYLAMSGFDNNSINKVKMNYTTKVLTSRFSYSPTEEKHEKRTIQLPPIVVESTVVEMT